MKKPTLSAALGNRYDTGRLISREIELPDFELEFPDAGEHPWVSFNRMVTSLPWDIGEQAFSHYVLARDQGVPLTAIPVFPSRFFPQLGAVVSRASGITSPSDLAGRKVGVFGFGYNPAVWMRKILEDAYGLDTSQIIWVEDEEDKFLNGLHYPKPDRFQLESMEFDSLAKAGGNPGPLSALEHGHIDAFFAPAGGPPLSDKTARLFKEPYQEINRWLDLTGVMPINTVITLRQSTVDQHPHLPQQLFDALRKAREQYHLETHAPGSDHLGIDTKFLYDKGLFPDQYGLEENRAPIEMMLESCFEQGLIGKRYEAQDLFHRVT